MEWWNGNGWFIADFLPELWLVKWWSLPWSLRRRRNYPTKGEKSWNGEGKKKQPVTDKKSEQKKRREEGMNYDLQFLFPSQLFYGSWWSNFPSFPLLLLHVFSQRAIYFLPSLHSNCHFTIIWFYSWILFEYHPKSDEYQGLLLTLSVGLLGNKCMIRFCSSSN